METTNRSEVGFPEALEGGGGGIQASAQSYDAGERGARDVSNKGHLSHGAKVKRGQINAVSQGRYGTGPAPYGYRRGGPGEKPLVINDREAEVVRAIFREYVNSRSTGKVVKYLQARGITTRKGKPWSRQAVSIILSNRTYRGRVTYANVEAEGQHNPIIDASLFYKANAIRERKQRNR
ncbi:MAG: recombinase family protein [Candidatus Hydrogenedentota bacterium]